MCTNKKGNIGKMPGPKMEADMKHTEEEKRRFQRLFFSAEEGISGFFRLPEPYHQMARGTLMDMNQEGIGLTFQKDECPQLVTGDSLVLLKIGDERFSFMEHIGMKIIWVLNHRSLDHMAMGCEFTAISSETKERIREILANWQHMNLH
ncbi:MAG: PilZ domain-containing protein [Desulfobacterales bacterium]